MFRTPEANKKHQEKITRLVSNMIAEDMLPFAFVEGKGFKKLINYLAPSYHIPSRNTFVNRINLLYDIRKIFNNS